MVVNRNWILMKWNEDDDDDNGEEEEPPSQIHKQRLDGVMMMMMIIIIVYKMKKTWPKWDNTKFWWAIAFPSRLILPRMVRSLLS